MKKRTGGAGAVLVAVISIILLAAAAWLGAGAVKKRGLEKGDGGARGGRLRAGSGLP